MIRNEIETIKIFDSTVVAASGSETSSMIDLTYSQGFQSIEYIITGSGTITLTFTLSNSGLYFFTPSDASDIGTDLAAGSNLLPIDLTMMASYLKIEATESGGANSATITAWLARQ